MQTAHVTFRKSFSRTSSHGITFHWLKCTYGMGFIDAIAEAVCIVYGPSALVALAESGEKITSAVILSRENFRQMMTFAKGSPMAGKPIPRRVEVVFSKKVDPAIEEGRVLGWLLRAYDDKATEAIVHAAWLLYSPAALASFPESCGEALVQVQRSWLVFEQKMAYAIALSMIDNKTRTIDRLNRSLVESSIDDAEGNAAPTASAAPEPSADVSPPAETKPVEKPVEAADKPVEAVDESDDDFDDDFVPPQYDLDF